LEKQLLTLRAVGKSVDPYLVIHYSDPNYKLPVPWRSKVVPVSGDSNKPSWRQRWHTLSTGLPATLRVEVWDKKQVVSDEMIGMVEVVLQGNTDVNVDTWFDLTRKNSKGVIVPAKGSIRIRYNFKFLDPEQLLAEAKADVSRSSSLPTLADASAALWPIGSGLMIEPVPFWNTVEIHGPIHDHQMLRLASGNITDSAGRRHELPRMDLLPFKQYDSKGEFIGWAIRASNQASSMTALSLQQHDERNAWDLTQAAALSLLDRLAICGFQLKRSDQLHRVEMGTGREKTVSLVHDRHFHPVVVPPSSSEQTSPSATSTTHILVEARLTRPDARWVVEIVGGVGKEVIDGLPAEDFDIKQVHETNTKRHVRWVAEVKNASKRFTFNSADVKRKENALLPFLVKVLNNLFKKGWKYVTVLGNQHVLSLSSSATAAAASAGSPTAAVAEHIKTAFILEPASILGDKEVQLIAQEVSSNYVKSIAKTMGYSGADQLNLAEMKDLAGKLQYYALTVPHASSAPLRTSQADSRQQENVMQNFMLNVAKRVVGSGYEIVGPIGLEGIFLQPTGSVRHSSKDAGALMPLTASVPSGRIALIDPCRTYGEFQIEIQGGMTEDEVVQLAAHNGFDRVKKRTDKNGFVIWVLPVKMTSHDSSYESLNTKTNRIQAHVVRSISYLHNTLSFTPICQSGDDNILLQHNPNRQPGTFILIDVSPTVNHISIEFQGDIDGSHVKQVASHAGLPNPDRLVQGKDDYHIGWRIKSGVQRMALWMSGQKSEQKRTKLRRLKSQWARIIDGLSQLGWQY
jgi:hypothetical protein